MDELSMRIFLAELETEMDRTLKAWKKEPNVDKDSVAQRGWQFEQAHIVMDLFWADKKERVKLALMHPNFKWLYEWAAITLDVRRNIIDRIGNFAQIAMHKRAD